MWSSEPTATGHWTRSPGSSSWAPTTAGSPAGCSGPRSWNWTAATAGWTGTAGWQCLFITHLHSDHTLGYADFIFTPWVLERNEPLQVYGPPGTDEMTQHLLAAYKEDIKLRLEGAEPANPVGYQVHVQEIIPGFIYTDENVTIRAFPVAHGGWEHAYGFRFETPDRVIVVSGDRAPAPDILEFAQGCDVLIHEVYSVKGFGRRVPVWQKYHSTAHTSAAGLTSAPLQAKLPREEKQSSRREMKWPHYMGWI